MNENNVIQFTNQIKKPLECPSCFSRDITLYGNRSKKRELVKIYACKACSRKFSGQILRGKQFPTALLLDGLTQFYLGHSSTEVIRILHKKWGTKVSEDALLRWVKEFASLCPFDRYREQALKHYQPEKMIESVRLKHQQLYEFRWHRAKLALLLEQHQNRGFGVIWDLLESVAKECPHDLFRKSKKSRASQSADTFSQDGVRVEWKQNLAVDVSRFVLQAVSENKKRHDAVQSFLIATDSATVAVEVPVLLRPEDWVEFRKQGYDIPEGLNGVVTGHIDVLQIRNGRVSILDFKPGAESVDATSQLTMYALSLSALTGIPLFQISCGWFSDTSFYEFWPLNVVKKLRTSSDDARSWESLYKKGA